jgi:non-lysosomal glucosylceramidase
MANNEGSDRRAFLRRAALGVAVAAEAAQPQTPANNPNTSAAPIAPGHVEPDYSPAHGVISYPRVFTGRQLEQIAFPLGGVAAGSLSLGGRGQLRDWEIFNRPNKGFSPPYAFPAIWVQAGDGKPVAHVLEARVLPPYTGESGLGSDNVPGLSRLASARFRGEYPLAHIDFEDSTLPVEVSLEAFSPIIPHDPEDSGLPVAILRYTVKNPGHTAAKVSVAFSIDNPVKVSEDQGGAAALHKDERMNELREAWALSGIRFSNPAIPATDPMHGSFALGFIGDNDATVTRWRGWPQGRWWNSPMLFWDEFSAHGTLGNEPDPRSTVGAVCAQRTIAPGKTGEFAFVMVWYFPNRTPNWCGWSAPKSEGDTIIGNHYSARFEDAWEISGYVLGNLETLEARTKLFARAMRESTLPAEVKDAASANLSTLASTTCFRTADGEFHGFEGVDDHRGCCFGNCTHVWNYETATAHLFPTFARSLREASFGYSMDDAGAIHFRQLLPGGHGGRWGYAAADGQMGQIVHAYLDWKLSGDNEWMKRMWPRVKKALEFAWVPGGWDANRDGVMEGVQHNTYDVEFYGPNPMCNIYYLAALRACVRMARAMGDSASADEYARLADAGGKWIDANLFNGEFYVQKVRGFRKDEIAPSLVGDMGSANTEKPEYQVGEGCFLDQLIGQYMADVAGLGPLVSVQNTRKALDSMWRYNYKRSFAQHDSVQRTYVLNDEAALVVCDYGKAERPRIPFPYYAESWTGLEYSTAALFVYSGMVKEGIECVRNARVRYDGERRNPWDEPECGHHYARAMSSWSTLLSLSGFRYDGPDATVVMAPPTTERPFQSFWSSGTGWGTFKLTPEGASLKVLFGDLKTGAIEYLGAQKPGVVSLGGDKLKYTAEAKAGRVTVRLGEVATLEEGQTLELRG